MPQLPRGNHVVVDREVLEDLASEVVDGAFKVHRELGPGLLESSYQACLAHILSKRSVPVECEVGLPLFFDGTRVDVGYRVDMIVGGVIIVENKAVQALAPIHQAQLMTYLKLSGLHLGFLINWNVCRLKDGLRRMVYRL
jgi:GxxExxY protein